MIIGKNGKKGYHLVEDILNKEGDLLSMEELKDRELRINSLDYIKIIINRLHIRLEKQAPILVPYLPRILFEIGISAKCCSSTYNKLMTHSTNTLKDINEKWENVLNDDLSYDIIENAFREITIANTGAYQK